MDTVLKILAGNCNRYVRLECGWILANIAYSSSEILEKLFNDHFIQAIATVFTEKPTDMVMLDQLMFLMGNLTGTSDQMRQKVRHYLNLETLMVQVLSE